MKKLFFIFLILLFGCTSVEKIGMANYPDCFLKGKTFDAVIVVDDFSSDDELVIVQNFVVKLKDRYKLNTDTLIQYKNLNGLYDRNTLFIGTCNTVPHNKFVNLFMDCLSMEDDIAMMRFVDQGNVTIISVVGKDFKDTKEALDVLLDYKKYDLSGTEIQVRNDETGKVFTRITGR